MKKFSFLSVVFAVSFLVISCESGDKNKAECITAFDCAEGWHCIEGKCVDPNAGVTDEDSQVILPDDGLKPDTDSGTEPDDVVHDPDIIEENDNDAANVPDEDEEYPDLIHDPDVISDTEVDEDAVDEDTVDDDIIIPVCGNGIPEEGEECDLGALLNVGGYGGCKSDCKLDIRCGDGIKNGTEFCDSGLNNGLYSFCKSDCTGPGERCNDGIINGPEYCDDGSSNNGKYGYCNAFCTALGLRCGDGYVNGPVGGPLEECDKGTDNGKTACVYGELSCKVCDALCKESDGSVEYCGDKIKNGPEDCDDGSDNGKYGYCNSTCTGINNCGDSIVTAPEICDKNTIACNAISGMGYNNTDVVSCNNGTCDAWLTSTCTCASGFEKDGTQKCVDTDECAPGNELLNNCHDNADCNNTSGSYYCTCKTNYSGDGVASCTPDTKVNQQCTAKPANTDWNTVSSITQTWDGENWMPSTTSVYNETSSITECRYKCSSGYHLDGGACVSSTRTGQACTGNPANSEWNTASTITQTWSGGTWSPTTAGTYNTDPSSTECRYKCKNNYNWNSPNCVAATQTASCSAKPANTDWNDSGKNGTYTQTWNGTAWAPTTSTTYNTTAGDCRYVCSSGYHYNGTDCIWSTRYDQACSSIPANTVYNTVSSIMQTWGGTNWVPSTTSVYNETASDTECRYKCADGYHREGNDCISNTRTNQTCTGLPSNAQWNTATSITQTWSGGVWSPTLTGTYNETTSTTTCVFKCANDYHWDGGACVSNTRTGQACTGNPVNSEWNTASTITQTWNGSAWVPSTVGTYSTTGSTTECYFQCKNNYNWNSPNCVAATQTASCSAKPANTDWNDGGKNGTYTQTWNGTAWAPVTATTYNTTAGDCRYVCSSGYHWETSICVSNTRTDQACSAKPANTDWNTVSSINQTWSGGVWSPTTTSSYNETASTTECRYKCSNGYHLDGGACISNTRTGQACTGLPSNAVYYNNTTSYSINQSYSEGSGWQPTTTAYYEDGNPASMTCEYKCATGYTYSGGACIGACPIPVTLSTWDSSTDSWSTSGNWARISAGDYRWDSWPGDGYMVYWNHPRATGYDSSITSPAVDLSGCSSVTVQFIVRYNDDPSVSGSNTLSLECYNGSGWTPVWTYSESSGSYAYNTLSYSLGSSCRRSNAQIRFRAQGSDSYGMNSWGVDEVKLK